jgi:hypothetical protein
MVAPVTDRRDRVAEIMHQIVLRQVARTRLPKRPRKRDDGIDGRKRPLTLEHRAKLRAAHAGRPGVPRSEITRAKISASQKLRHPKPMAQCHPDRLHFGHGKCRQCYNRDYMRARRHGSDQSS